MELALVLSAVLLGLSGAPHCAAMCGPTCAALLGRSPSGAAPVSNALAFHGARVAGYAAAGALVAGGAAVLAAAGSAAPLLRPLWTLVHIAALALGLYLLLTGRQPHWMTRIGRARPSRSPALAGWQPMRGPARGAAAGSVWVAWPCGLLQSALVVAALANTPSGGAAVMAGFALASAAGLQLTPWIAARLASRGGAGRFGRATVHLAGAALVAGSAWAFGGDVWSKVVAYCS
ncbi:MAG TPA: sulfite exporter TauE/SafE family protein [Rubrivivax sp.]